MSNSSDLRAALEAAMEQMKAKRDKWRKEHPDEPDMPECPLCRGTGLEWIYKDIDGNPVDYDKRNNPGVYEFVAPCRCIKREMTDQYKANKNFSNVPNMYSDASFKTFRTDIYGKIDSKQLAAIAKNTAQMFVSKFEECAEQGISLYIWSKSRGSGKSRLASTIANELTFKGIRNKFVGAASLLSEIQGSWDDKDVSTHKILENYIKPKLLIIDDLGERGNKDWINNNLFLIIDRRYQERKPTIFTSNFDIMDLPLDTRMTDRLTEICLNLKLPDESIRQNQKSHVSDMFNKIVRGEDVNDD